MRIRNFWKQSMQKIIFFKQQICSMDMIRNALNVLKDDLLVKIEELSK